MTSLEPLGEDEQFAQLQKAVREHNSTQIKTLLSALQPYVDGSFGRVEAPYVKVYLDALRQLGQLWKVFDRPIQVESAGVDEDKAAQVALGEQKARVLAELDKLRQIADRRGS